jgi:hypothetical protein
MHEKATSSQARDRPQVLPNAHFHARVETNAILPHDPLLGNLSLVSDKTIPHLVHGHLSANPKSQVLTPATMFMYDRPEMDIARLLQQRPEATRFSSLMFPDLGDRMMSQANLGASTLLLFQTQRHHHQGHPAFS